MAARSPARLLAPVALAAAAIAVYAITKSSGDDAGSKFAPTSSAPAKARPQRARVYVVRVGDVLGAIAQRTGVSVARILRLNPGIDPEALHPGQKLKLSK